MKLIVGNWKMYPSALSEAKKIIKVIKKNAGKHPRAKVVVCPPSLFILPMVALAKRATIAIGAQNAFSVDEGAYTGELSPLALAKIGATHVIVGHSERRALGESNATIAKKAVAAVRNELKVILCIGETVRDEAGAYFTEVAQALRASLEGFPKSETRRLIIAYEPIWAIGTKAVAAATPKDFCEMSIFIRRNLVDRFGKKIGFAIPILYGGSADERNAGEFLQAGGADGLLIGRASLDPEKFSAIIKIAQHIR